MTRIKPVTRSPLHAQVTQALRNEIVMRGRSGDRLDSEDKLAQQFGVSVLTLRHSLGALAHEGLIERRQGSGTFITDRKRHQSVAICTLTFSTQPMTSFHMRLFFLLGEKFQRAGYQCRLHAVPMGLSEGWSEFTRDLERGQVCGAAFVGVNPDMTIFPRLGAGVPFVGGDPGKSPVVGPDGDQILRDGIRHLLKRGCRRIALMESNRALSSASSYEKLRAILSEFGLPLHPEWIRWGIAPSTPGSGWEQFREIWTSRKEKPDGLLVTDDMLFRDVAMALLECGIKVPSQLKVVTHANKGSGLTYPFPVSRLEVDPDEWADAMANQLIRLMNREPVEPHVHHIVARFIPAEEGPEAKLFAGAAAPSN